MRKAAEERRHREHGLRGGAAALSPAAPVHTAAAVSTDYKAQPADPTASTTIGRYIARFRYEQPLPREARSSVLKEDFWWKSGGSSPSHRRSRVRQRSTREGGSEEREGGGGDEDDDGVSSLAMSGSVSGSVNSVKVKSGYNLYIPEPQVHQEAYNTPVADSDALLLLSSASWSSLPSDLEPPSSSQESLPRDLTKLPSRAPWKTPHSNAHRHSDAETVALGVQDDDEEEDVDDESKVEDTELVIERVRKRLGWSSSDDDSDAMSFKRYDAPSSSSPMSPMMMQGRPRSQRDYFHEFPLATSSPALSGRLGDGDDEDDEILSGTMRVPGGTPESTPVKPLQLALNELSNENRYQPQDLRQFDESALAPRATADPYSKSGNQTVGAFAPLQSVESPVLPVWRRGFNSSLSSSSANSSSFPPRVLAPSPSSSSTLAPPRSSTQSSLSSVTAETAKTLDGLVSLVVQSWSNDFFFGAESDDKNGDGAQETSESVEKETIGDGGDNEDEAVGDLAGQEDIRSVHESVVEARVAPPLQVEDESSSQIPEPSPLREENPVLPSLFSKLNGLQPAAKEDGSADSDKVDSNAASESYDSEKEEEEENAETGDDEDDEIVRLLLSRIVLYEEALRRLEAANIPPPDKHGDSDE